MMKKKFIDFMTSEETSGEVEGIFNEFKKLFYEVKEQNFERPYPFSLF